MMLRDNAEEQIEHAHSVNGYQISEFFHSFPPGHTGVTVQCDFDNDQTRLGLQK